MELTTRQLRTGKLEMLPIHKTRKGIKKVKEQVIKEAERSIEEFRQAIKLLDRLPDGPFDFLVKMTIGSCATVHVTIPFDISAYRAYRKAMGKGWKCDGWSDTIFNTHIARCRTYCPKGWNMWDGPRVLLALDTALKGATCRMEQVGVEEKPVYKVVCN